MGSFCLRWDSLTDIAFIYVLGTHINNHFEIPSSYHCYQVDLRDAVSASDIAVYVFDLFTAAGHEGILHTYLGGAIVFASVHVVVVTSLLLSITILLR